MRLLICALWSPAGKWQTFWLSLAVYNCEFVTFHFGILGQVWYLIVSIPDLCTLTFFDSIIVKLEDVRDTLKSLPIGKAVGPDLINNQPLEELAQPLALPLSDLFNFSLFYSGSVPHIWKQAYVIPIHKKNDPSDVPNYRPISLLSTVSNVYKLIQ